MQFSLKNDPKLTVSLQWIVSAVLSLAFIASLFLAPPGVESTRVFFEFGLDRLLFLLVLFALIFNLNGFAGKTLAFTFTLALFCMPLLYKWQMTDYFSTLGGLLPMRDANSYYQEAQNLGYGFPFTGSAAFRPIYTAFLATIMKAAGGNLQISLIALTAFNGLAVYFAANEIKRALKSGATSAIFVVITYMFYRRFGGTLLTENLGFCLGMLSLVFLIRGSAERNLKYLLFGLFLLTTGLNARAGAYLILPILALWMGWSLRDSLGFWRPFIYGMLVVIIGMAANSVLIRLVSASPSAAFSNYSYTLYGIAVGNKGWEQAGIDHPTASAGEVYELAFQSIRENPALFIQGVAGAYADYFVASKGAFSFLLMKHDRNDVANLVLWIFTFAGLISGVIHRRKLEFGISLAFFVGIILSVGLVPPADSTQMRAYAATIPMTCYLVSVGIALPGKLLPGSKDSLAAEEETGLFIPMGLSGLILASAFILPLAIKTLGQPPKSNPTIDCEAGRQKLLFVIADGSSITLSSEKDNSFIPNLDRLRFYGKLVHPEQQLSPEEKEMVLQLEPETTITITRMVLDEFDAPPLAVSSFVLTKGIPQPGVYIWCVEVPQFPGFYIPPASEYQAKESFSLPASAQTAIRTIRSAGLWLVFGALFVSLIGVWKIPVEKLPLGLSSAVLIACGLLMLLHMSGLVPLAWERRTIEPEKIQHRDGFMYAYFTGDNQISDTTYRDYPTYLYEGGRLLYQPHESQSFVAALGRGSYILKEKFLYFSTSDNSDPETNGREYTLEYPARVRLRYQWIGFGAGLIGLLLYFFYLMPGFRRRDG
jgi:hypothetical protein